MTLAIAIVALLVAGYAVYLTRKVRDALAELADAEEEEEGDPESAELWISSGDLHTPDVKALYAATGALAIYMEEYVPMAVIDGKGTISLHKLLSEGAKADKPAVRSIK